MLVCVDDFSNYIMIKLLHNKKAKTIHDAIIDLIKSEGIMPTIIYCDQGNELNNKLFNNPQMNFLKFNSQSTGERPYMQNMQYAQSEKV